MNGLERLLLEKKLRISFLNKSVQTLLEDFHVDDALGINLELGSGHGHWLTSYSQLNQESYFLGIDLITKRVEKANQKVSKRNLNNISFLKADAFELLESLPSDISIQNCFIMYPDPWPKKRHHKRRLLNERFLELLATKCKKSSKLFFMTDHDDYFVSSHNMILNSNLWSLKEEKWPHAEKSYFQDLLPQNNFFVADYQIL